MDSLQIISQVFGSLGAIGVLVVVIVLWKLGFFDKKNGDEIKTTLQNHRVDIKQLYGHAEIANREMGEIKTDIAVIKTDMGNIKDDVKEIKEAVKK